jgi:hypothetical protein
VFLDFDGVLVRADGVPSDSDSQLDRSLIAELNALVQRSGAAVVVSSSWRIAGVDKMRAVLREHGFVGEVVGITPILGLSRGLEIQAWLDRCAWTVSQIVILDDDDDMAHLLPHLVRTDLRRGLTAANTADALRILGLSGAESAAR